MNSTRLPGISKRLGYLFHSIRFRLVLWFAAILAIVLAAFSIFVYINQSRDIRSEAEYRLERKLAAFDETLTLTANGIYLPQGVLQDTDILILVSNNGQVIASRGPIPNDDADTLARQAVGEFQDHHDSSDGFVSWSQRDGLSNSNYIFVTVPIVGFSRQTGLAILGSPLDPSGLFGRLRFTLLAGTLLTLTIALVGGFWLADRAMRPVHTITQAARSIGETDLSRRLNMKGKDELGELANTFDAMLARLQAAFERQRQFVADASHELRTPLTIVNLETSRVLASRRPVDDYQQALQIIHSENDFMTGLVNDLLTLARMDAGQTAMEKFPVDLSDVAVETVERLAPLSDRRGVILEAGNLPEVHIFGDRKYLIQMMSNLVENAIKYTTGPEKRVCIETGSSDGSAWVSVSDTGPGISPEHLPHLFDRFYRVDKSRTHLTDEESAHNEATGSGLGLSIVQWIVHSHDGEINVESTLGVGTKFEVRFKSA
jgi:heavy metal sensor kinase